MFFCLKKNLKLALYCVTLFDKVEVGLKSKDKKVFFVQRHLKFIERKIKKKI